MTPRSHLLLLALLSGLATALVLTTGSGASGGSGAIVAGKTTTIALAAAPAPVSTTTAAPEPEANPEPTTPAPAATESAPTTTAADATADPEPATETATETTPAETTATRTTPAADEPRETHIKHVFAIVLAGRGFDAAFGPGSPATYLNTDLRPKSVLLSGYHSLGRGDLPDHLALISGQPPNADTRAGCPTYTEIAPTAKPTSTGEIRATGCAYPNTVVTVADQLTADGRTWRAYVEDLDKGQPPRPTCRRPASNAPDDAVTGRPGDGYATRHNPFVYFHSLLDLGGCDSADGPLTALDADLASAKKTPALSYIVPNLCNDGTESPCVDGNPGGLAAADAFLAQWVPKILASKAYQDDGLLLVTFAGNVAAAPDDDAPSRNGALVVSRFATAGTTADTELDPYAVLRTVQDALALRPLARAAQAPSLLESVLAAARIARPGDD